MGTFSYVLLAISTVAASVAALTSLLALGQSNEAAFHQYQAQTLANLADRRRRVEEIGSLIEDIFSGHPALRTPDVAQARLPHALVGLRDKFPVCSSLEQTALTPEIVRAARAEVQRELTVLAMAVDITEARRLPRGRISSLLYRNQAAIPYPKATAP